VSRPLPAEEDLALEVLAALDPPQRSIAVVSGQAPYDIRSGTRPRAEAARVPVPT